MSLFVDTSVWSLVFRRDDHGDAPEAVRLIDAIEDGDDILTTGIVLQELLQGFRGAMQHDQIIARFAAVPLLVPSRADFIDAARVRNTCRQRGVQVGTVDALIAQMCLHYELTMLTADRDFFRISAIFPLRVWNTH